MIPIQKILVRSKLRVPLYVLTVITGIAFFLDPNSFSPTYFVIFFGLLLIYESIHPNGYTVIVKEVTHFLPKTIQTIVMIITIGFLIVLGAFILGIGIYVELHQLLD
ncbi:hypothetical protein CJ195_17430 [Bacillus sp. UMB0899]|nr:hypothetical protein CJ195_17430 [Bacillus sp. UMB0899]